MVASVVTTTSWSKARQTRRRSSRSRWCSLATVELERPGTHRVLIYVVFFLLRVVRALRVPLVVKSEHVISLALSRECRPSFRGEWREYQPSDGRGDQSAVKRSAVQAESGHDNSAPVWDWDVTRPARKEHEVAHEQLCSSERDRLRWYIPNSQVNQQIIRIVGVVSWERVEERVSRTVLPGTVFSRAGRLPLKLRSIPTLLF